MYIYAIRSECGYVKIGLAANPEARRRQLVECQPFDAMVELAIEVADDLALATERRAHRRLASKRVRGEWFDATAEEAASAIQTEEERPRTLEEIDDFYASRPFEFSAWLERMAFTDVEAASQLGIVRATIAKYRKTDKVPRIVAMACQTIEMGAPLWGTPEADEFMKLYKPKARVR